MISFAFSMQKMVVNCNLLYHIIIRILVALRYSNHFEMARKLQFVTFVITTRCKRRHLKGISHLIHAALVRGRRASASDKPNNSGDRRIDARLRDTSETISDCSRYLKTTRLT